MHHFMFIIKISCKIVNPNFPFWHTIWKRKGYDNIQHKTAKLHTSRKALFHWIAAKTTFHRLNSAPFNLLRYKKPEKIFSLFSSCLKQQLLQSNTAKSFLRRIVGFSKKITRKKSNDDFFSKSKLNENLLQKSEK